MIVLKSDPISLSLPECSNLSLVRKWFSNNWKKNTFLRIQEKGLKIFSWKWLPNLNKKKIFPGEGVFHAAAGTEAEADDLDWWVFFFSYGLD